MKQMKKISILLLILALMCLFIACGKDITQNKEVSDTNAMTYDNNNIQEPVDIEPNAMLINDPDDPDEAIDYTPSPSAYIAPKKPTERVRHIGEVFSSSGNLKEKITYNEDGGYTATGELYDYNKKCSYDIVHTYDQHGELKEYKIVEYSAENPNGYAQVFETEHGFIQNIEYMQGDKVLEGWTDVYGLDGYIYKNISVTDLQELYEYGGVPEFKEYGIKSISFHSSTYYGFEEDLPIEVDIDEVSEEKTAINFSYTGEAYNVTSRKTEESTVYLGTYEINYNPSGLISSLFFYKYTDSEVWMVDIHNLDETGADSYLKYSYDSENNLTEIRGCWDYGEPESVITYSYESD